MYFLVFVTINVLDSFKMNVINHLKDALSQGLYGAEGPTVDEETRDSVPPERVFGVGQLTPNPSFDSWSIGVLMLEVYVSVCMCVCVCSFILI
jgi:hypothetical protein